MRTFGAFFLVLLFAPLAHAQAVATGGADLTSWQSLIAAGFSLGAFMLKKRFDDEHPIHSWWAQALVGLGVAICTACGDAIVAHGFSKNTLIYAAAGAAMTWMLAANSKGKSTAAAMLPFIFFLGGCEESSYSYGTLVLDLALVFGCVHFIRTGLVGRRHVLAVLALPYALALMSAFMALPGCLPAEAYQVARKTQGAAALTLLASYQTWVEWDEQHMTAIVDTSTSFQEGLSKLSSYQASIQTPVRVAFKTAKEAIEQLRDALDAYDKTKSGDYIGVVAKVTAAFARLAELYEEFKLNLETPKLKISHAPYRLVAQLRWSMGGI